MLQEAAEEVLTYLHFPQEPLSGSSIPPIPWSG
jgi:hypothetical protein